ncbi:MAG: IclR family transcriptional regulator [Betaproteobacteria bacterium]|nr:MAG: IclR family transcriptional regulator [Betaproteobacteria bacterium]
MSRNLGTQALDRAVAVLRLLATVDGTGLRLLDVQARLGLQKPTAHRILQALGRHGLVEQDPETRRYRLGYEVAILGSLLARRTPDLRRLFAGEMQDLAEETGDTAFLHLRSGSDCVCIERTMGPYPIKAFTVDVGTRRPLGVGAGSIALLAAMERADEEAVYDAVRGRLRDFPNVNEKVIRGAVRAAREKGYALSDGYVLSGVRGVGIAIYDRSGAAIAALSIAAIRERVLPDRIDLLVRALERRRRFVERRLAIRSAA